MLSKVLNNRFSEAVQKDKDRKPDGSEEHNDKNESKFVQQATNFMGNMYPFAKNFRGAIFGGPNSNEQAAGGDPNEERKMSLSDAKKT